MIVRVGTALLWCALLTIPMLGQNKSVIVTSGYSPPSRTDTLSPGQVVTLFIRGITATDSQAPQGAWPLVLSGVSAVMREPRYGYTRPVPILRIQTVSCGQGTVYVCDVRAVTIQIPVDLPGLPPSDSGLAPATPTITVSENGIEGSAAEFRFIPAQFTILNDCQVFIKGTAAICSYQVTHADGTLLSATNPAKRGETVVLYAVGLGLTAPIVGEGRVTPSPAPRVLANLLAAYSADQLPASTQTDATWSQPTFAGLVPGYVGLYQINLRLPDLLPQGGSVSGNGSRTITLTLDSNGRRDSALVWVVP